MADVQYASSAMPSYFPHPPWHPLYSLTRDAVKSALKLCAADVYAKMKAALAIKSAQEMRENMTMHFEPSSRSPTAVTVDTAVPSPVIFALDETDVMLNDVSSTKNRWRFFDGCLHVGDGYDWIRMYLEVSEERLQACSAMAVE